MIRLPVFAGWQDLLVTQSRSHQEAVTHRQEEIRVASFIQRDVKACYSHSATAIHIRLRGFKCPSNDQLKAACGGSLGREEQSQSRCSRLHISEYNACFQDHWLHAPPFTPGIWCHLNTRAFKVSRNEREVFAKKSMWSDTSHKNESQK